MKQRTRRDLKILLAAGILILGWTLSRSLPGRFDFTENGLYSLGPESRSVVRSISEPLELEFYFTERSRVLPVAVKNYARRIEELLRAFVRASNGKIRLTVRDPEPDSAGELEAMQAGIERRQLSRVDHLLFGMIARRGDQEVVIPFLEPEREPFVEYDVLSLILDLEPGEKPVVGIFSPLRLRGPEDPLGRKRPGLAEAFLAEMGRRYRLESIRDLEDLPRRDPDVLLLLHPPTLQPTDLYALDQYLMRGRGVFLAIDPSHFEGRLRDPTGASGLARIQSDLPRLLEGWGLVHDIDEVIADPRHAMAVRDPESGLAVDFPVWIRLAGEAGETPVTAEVDTFDYIEGTAFRVMASDADQWIPLVKTSEIAGTLLASSIGVAPTARLGDQIGRVRESRPVALLRTGDFQSLFPEGKPLTETDDPAEELLRLLQDPMEGHLAETEAPARLVVIGDVDFLMDRFAVREAEFAGGRGQIPANDNLAFALNAVDFLAGRSDLLGLRGKGTATRRFERIAELEATAAARWMDRLQTLEGRLRDVALRIRNLVNQEDADPATLERELSAARLEEQQLRIEQKEVIRALRAEVDRMEVGLALLNFFLVPTALGAFGILYFFRRTRRVRGGRVAGKRENS